jgi:L-amino acid N-acyltransferase YncA
VVDVAKCMRIQKLVHDDFEMLCCIYKQGIKIWFATFQTEVPNWEQWNNTHLMFGRIGTFENNQLIGWASLSPVSSKCVYCGMAEVSVYTHEAHRNKGVGRFLLNELICESEQNDIWTLQSSVFPENTASIQLHLNCGFRIVGTREKIGLKDGILKDNIILERRSKTIGAH